METVPEIFRAVVGTAGHIDHGKSSLVKALTGTDPDRLKEERERGLTIDLGYAEYTTTTGRQVGLIDVPGHERFIRNMVAGATGLDVVMLVVAADDSVMPQTREHLEIMRILGLTRGFVVMTKIDLVEEGMPDLVEEELADFTRGTFLEGAPVVRCSNVTGEGLDAVRAELERQVATVPPKDASGPFRLPIQRSFTVKGHGTVVTGVPLSGSVAVGDALEVLPQGVVARVRSIQAHHLSVPRAGAGQRVALNLSDVNWKDVGRGCSVCAPGIFSASPLIEVRFKLLPSFGRKLASHVPVRFHANTTETLGTLVLLDAKEVDPGGDVFAQVRLEEPVIVAPGDRFLLRLASPERTLGGGLILGETKFRHKQSRNWITDNLAAKEQALGDRAAYVEAVIRAQSLHPVAPADLPAMVRATEAETQPIVDALVAKGRIVRVPGLGTLLHVEPVEVGARAVEESLSALHQANHYAWGFGLFDIASSVRHPPAVVELFLADAVRRGTVERQNPEWRLRAFKGGLSQEDRRLIGWLEERLRSTGMATPLPADLAKEAQRPEKRILNLLTMLEAQGKAKRLDESVVLHREALDAARDRVVAHCVEKGQITSIEAKDVIGGTRKYVIPLLEHFDAIGLTVRKDSVRTLKPGWESIVAPKA